MKTARTSRTVRAALLASAAGLCLSLAAGSAQAAEDAINDGTLVRPLLAGATGASSDHRIARDGIVRESQAGHSTADVLNDTQTFQIPSDNLLREAQTIGSDVPRVEPTPEI